MLNQVVLVGRITSDIEVNQSVKGKKYANINLAIPRAYKNMDGTYDTDFIKCTLWDGVANNTAEYCKKGDIVGIKGRVQSHTRELDDGTKMNSMEVIAEKVTFLSSKRQEEAE